MAITNHERVGKTLDLLNQGLVPFVERELAARYGKYWITAVTANWPNDPKWPEDQEQPHFASAAILRLHEERQQRQHDAIAEHVYKNGNEDDEEGRRQGDLPIIKVVSGLIIHSTHHFLLTL